MAVTYEVIQDTVLSGTASIGIGASAEVTIRDADTSGLVTLFQDRLGAVGETNPFNADANGQFRVYTLPGRLQISITFESVTRIWEDFRLGPKTPTLAAGDAGKILRVRPDEDGYDLDQSMPDITASDAEKIIRVNAAGDGYDLAEIALGRNTIINSTMRIDQRDSDAGAVTVNSTTPAYGPDRFFGVLEGSGGGAFTIERELDAPDDFEFSCLITVTVLDAAMAAGDAYVFGQRIEADNITRFGFGRSWAKEATLSFRVKSSLTGTYSIALVNADEDRSFVKTFTIDVADTWETKEITFIADTGTAWNNTGNGIGLSAYITLAAGSNFEGTDNTWEAAHDLTVSGNVNFMSSSTSRTMNVTGMALVLGAQAGDFPWLDFQDELDRCYRYYYRIDGISNPITNGYVFGTTAGRFIMRLPVTQRATTTVGFSGQADFLVVRGNGIAIASISAAGALENNKSVFLAIGTAGSLIDKEGCTLRTKASGSPFLDFDAEL